MDELPRRSPYGDKWINAKPARLAWIAPLLGAVFLAAAFYTAL